MRRVGLCPIDEYLRSMIKLNSNMVNNKAVEMTIELTV